MGPTPDSIEPQSSSSKVVPVVIASIVMAALVAGGSVYAYEKNQNDSSQARLQSQIESLKTQVAKKSPVSISPITTATPSAAPSLSSNSLAVSSEVFKSSIVNLQFTYPNDSSYREIEPLKSREAQGLKQTGHQVYFSDKNKLRPSFDATTGDFTAQDSIPHNLLVGTLENRTTFTIASFEKSTMITTEVSPGMFQATAYGNQECTPAVGSYLFVRPPQGTSLKYISFDLGSDEFSQNEIETTCVPTIEAKTRRISNLSTSTAVITALNKSIAIAKTFSIK